MSHIHIPDGVFPTWLVIAGWILTLGILYLCIRSVRNAGLEHRLPIIGIVSALMIVGMTLEIVPIAYHINMSVIAGIVLGPALGFISVFIVDLIIAMFGHGGITVVGLNTLVVGAEAVLGFYLFRAFCGVLSRGRLSVGFSSALATVFSLILSTSLMIGIIYVSQVNPERVLYKNRQPNIEETIPQKEHGDNERYPAKDGKIDIGVFAKTVFFLGVFGWILESVITGFVIGYVSRVRPDLIFSDVT
ncbi:MAG TPA: energy-coupling factor ABC transporter permease [Thermodesulfobacteriota bacterium]|jgi:cobalt/nickel transport system permease protein|nr:energy-coupling factor ABC transporter permease [Thermodesulfobacteriota bacterium]